MSTGLEDDMSYALRRQDDRRAAVLADADLPYYCAPCGLCVNCDRMPESERERDRRRALI